MKNFTRTWRKLLFGTGLLAGVLPAALAGPPQCDTGDLVPVAGKIFNNGLPTGMTLGTIHLKMGPEKMKCGILGQGGSDGTSIFFTHTFVCDDEVLYPPTAEAVHSQLTLQTVGYANTEACPQGYPPGSFYGTFSETSTPFSADGSTGRGLFEGVTEGNVQIEGTINCLGAINMKFSGYVCLPPR